MSIVLLAALTVGQFGGIAREMTIIDADGTPHVAIMSAGDLPPRQLVAHPWIEPFPQPVRTNGRDTAVIVGYGMTRGVFGTGPGGQARATKPPVKAKAKPTAPTAAEHAAGIERSRQMKAAYDKRVADGG